MFETIVHHTLKDLNNPEEVVSSGPWPVKNWRHAYLGKGTYFWDDHLKLAHWWGQNYCKKTGYMICEGEIKASKLVMLDLVGSRQDMEVLKGLISTFDLQELPLGAAIEYLKDIAKKYENLRIFPFKVIRAVDNKKISNWRSRLVRFASGKPGETDLSPRIIICLLEKSNLFLRNFRILYPEKYVLEKNRNLSSD